MNEEQNKAAIRRFYNEVWNAGNLEVAAEIFATDYVRHDLRPGTPPSGPEGQMEVARQFRAAFPDVRVSIDQLVAEDDMVVARWTIEGTHRGAWGAIPATGRAIAFSGVNIFRFAGDMVAEIWNFRDDLGLMQQLEASSDSALGASESSPS